MGALVQLCPCINKWKEVLNRSLLKMHAACFCNYFRSLKAKKFCCVPPPVVVNLPPPMQGTHIHTKLNVQGRRMPGGGEDGMHR